MRRVILSFIAGLVVGAILWWTVPQVLDLAVGHHRSLDRAFNSVGLHLPRAEVVKRMESDGHFDRRFYLAQRAGYDFEYAAAERSGATYFLSWNNGIDWCYTFGFDQDDKVVFKAQGGT